MGRWSLCEWAGDSAVGVERGAGESNRNSTGTNRQSDKQCACLSNNASPHIASRFPAPPALLCHRCTIVTAARLPRVSLLPCQRSGRFTFYRCAFVAFFDSMCLGSGGPAIEFFRTTCEAFFGSLHVSQGHYIQQLCMCACLHLDFFFVTCDQKEAGIKMWLQVIEYTAARILHLFQIQILPPRWGAQARTPHTHTTTTMHRTRTRRRVPSARAVPASAVM